MSTLESRTYTVEEYQAAFNKAVHEDMSAYVEKKNNLSYVSWVWAWNKMNQFYPDVTATVYEDANGCIYHTDGKTCWVKTGITAMGKEIIEYLPIMDFRNSSIPLEKVTSMDVNKAIQRSQTKAMARHGVGLYVYAGEDLPEETEEAKQARLAMEETIATLIRKIDVSIRAVTHNMSQDDKIKFANEVLVPIVGTMNYKQCRDGDKLQQLLETLDGMAAAMTSEVKPEKKASRKSA